MGNKSRQVPFDCFLDVNTLMTVHACNNPTCQEAPFPFARTSIQNLRKDSFDEYIMILTNTHDNLHDYAQHEVSQRSTHQDWLAIVGSYLDRKNVGYHALVQST